MKKKLTRRQFLLAMLSAGAAGITFTKTGQVLGADGSKVFLPFISGPQGTPEPTPEPTPNPTPIPTPSPTPNPTLPPPGGSRVVRVHSNTVTDWTGSGNYWDHVSQDRVNAMVNEGVCGLTGKATSAEAWRAILPNYVAGQGIAIKANFNNTMDPYGCSNPSPEINPLPQIAIPVIEGLKSIGVLETNICFYDGVGRRIPDYFYSPIHSTFPEVLFYDACHLPVELSNGYINFYPPTGTMPSQKIAKPAEDANYLINIPDVKNHYNAGITLGFKNHFGTIQHPGDLHTRTFVTNEGTEYRLDYNPLVDINKSPLIGSKTVLTLGNGIFGSLGNQSAIPNIWPNTFGDYPKSLFFAKDPVAIDCVMADFLDAEWGNYQNSSRYLELAEQAGLGIFEHVVNPLANPNGYTKIDYKVIEQS
ncbi:MAG: DUF362 domain-containing protein [Chloroflexi bacterium]|nr:DUF362 domain-containing protein [Chloroflexota bacterium]